MDIEIVNQPFTMGSLEVHTTLERLRDRARQHEWDVVIGLAELPFRDEDDGRSLPAETATNPGATE